LKIGGHVFSFARQLGADLGILELLLEPAKGLDLLREARAGLQNRLGACGIVPESGIGDGGLDARQLAVEGLLIKGAPGAPRTAP
jgi:hypothetical protein